MSKKLICGVGINDADYLVRSTINGKDVWCPFYRVWAGIIERCYSTKFHTKRPTYMNCTITDEWLTFSNFKKWMETQDWQNKAIDKDLLVTGNKMYSPDYCCFLYPTTNSFLITPSKNLRQGIHYRKDKKKFKATCSNPFTKKSEHLGYFSCPDQAHQAWKNRKHELACQHAGMYTDPRVKQALITRYLS